jgi:ATP synthase H subunit
MSDEQEQSNALKALQKVKEAEEEARRIIREAQDTTSVQIIQDAQEEARKIMENALEEARRNGQVKRAAIVQKAKMEAEEITNKGGQEKSALRQKTESQFEAVVAKVAEKIKVFLKEGDL